MNQHIILIVEDDAIQRRQIARSLVADGHTVSTASTGTEAIQQLNREQIAIVLTDRKMPGMDGVELLEYIRRNHPKILVAMITAYPGEIKDTAPDALLSKPFGHRELAELVKCLLRKMQELAVNHKQRKCVKKS